MRVPFGLERRHHDSHYLEGEFHRWIYSCTTKEAHHFESFYDVPETVSLLSRYKGRLFSNFIDEWYTPLSRAPKGSPSVRSLPNVLDPS